MKKKYFLLLIFLITLTLSKAQDGWITHKGDDRISIKFPTEPSELTPGSVIAIGKDSMGYVFTIVDFKKVADIDSLAIAPIKDTPEFAGQIKAGMKGTLPNVDFPDFTISKWKGSKSYSSCGHDSKNGNYILFMFIIGNKLYSVSTISASGISTEANSIFVNSIILSN